MRWKPVVSAFKNMAAVAVNAKRPLGVYAAMEDGRRYQSADGGKTWHLQR
jgi:hypothetical protein